MPKGEGKDRESLERYRAKRSASATPEPFGGLVLPDDPDWTKPRLFVVQKHAARRLHYDFRLEWRGTLVSWAIPNGPSADVNEKRMAVMVEDHPVEYADFEGVIPAGNYGAGEVIVWDKGVWIPVEDPDEGFEKGKLLFDLKGFKLGGRWTLVRTKRQGQTESKEWLLIKKPDAYAGADGAARLTAESIYSGRALEEIAEGSTKFARLAEGLAAKNTPRGVVDPKGGFMLAEDAEKPFSSPEWIFELKYDGYRMMVDVDGDAGKADLYYRRGSRVTDLYPEVAKAASLLPFPKLVLDGELVCLDENARPDFSRLQQRSQLRRTVDIASAAVRLPATFHAFDILALGEFDLRSLPLVDRKAILKEVLPKAGPLRYCDHVEEHGAAFFAEVEKLGLEGVVAKKKGSKYAARRSDEWRKFKSERIADFVVIGFTPPDGSRTAFGALHLAYYEAATVDPSGRNPPELRYAGRVGSGFTEDQLRAFHARLVEDVIDEAPCRVSEEGSVKGETFVRPRHVVEVRYKTWTAQEHLRQPVFLRWRDDKAAADCVLSGPPLAAAPTANSDDATAPSGAASAVAADDPKVTVDKTIHFTNLTKVFWPKTDEDPAYTKGDLIDYYRRIAPWFLRYLADRPITLTRYPDGINGKSFFQKDAPPFIPGWVRTERLWNEDAKRDVDLIVGGERERGDVETLLFLANLGTIVLHAWNARVSSPAHPDWIILDLDPKDAPFVNVIALARAARALCDEVELPSFAKTTGSSGLHVLIPTGGALTHEQCKTFAELLARVIVARHEKIATVTRNPALRGGKVYVDFLQNGHGKLLVAPFSVRPLPRAPVSMPLRWEDVTDDLTPRRFTIANAVPHLETVGTDPLAGVLTERPDLLGALGRLGERVG